LNKVLDVNYHIVASNDKMLQNTDSLAEKCLFMTCTLGLASYSSFVWFIHIRIRIEIC